MIGKEKKQTEQTQNPNDFIVVSADSIDDDTIDLGKIFGMLLDHVQYIVLCFLVGALLFSAFAYFMKHPTYQSTAKLYAVSASDDTVVNFADLNIGAALTKDYEELIYSYPVLEEVIDKLNLDMTSDDLSQMITIENPEDTRVLRITTTSTDAKEAQKITNTLVESLRTYLPRAMSTTKPNIVQRGKLENEKVGPSYLKYLLIGGFLFAVIYVVILIIRFLLDDTLKTAEDIENEFGFAPLTVIPENDIFIEDDEKPTKKKGLLRRAK
ncbi:MAG: capsular polysaccharide biosynthesis protein [Eubacterium sp.]|nr:capsular polysaccharide biosynthesis protein [Eubacterium sp.]